MRINGVIKFLEETARDYHGGMVVELAIVAENNAPLLYANGHVYEHDVLDISVGYSAFRTRAASVDTLLARIEKKAKQQVIEYDYSHLDVYLKNRLWVANAHEIHTGVCVTSATVKDGETVILWADTIYHA